MEPHEQDANKYSPEVRERAGRMVLDNEGQHVSRWAAILSILILPGESGRGQAAMRSISAGER